MLVFLFFVYLSFVILLRNMKVRTDKLCVSPGPFITVTISLSKSYLPTKLMQ